jgi:streptothricin acetyltransferase
MLCVSGIIYVVFYLLDIMAFRIIQIDDSRLHEFDDIAISFEVRSFYEVINDNERIELIEQPLLKPYVKDYDQLNSNSSHSWSNMESTNWGIFLAIDDTQNERPVGGAIVIMPECALWDLRVVPSHRRLGVGRALLKHAIEWAKQQGRTTRMSIETQNTNVSACRFYAAMGAKLGDIDRNAYQNDEEVKHEIRLNWYIDLNK